MMKVTVNLEDAPKFAAGLVKEGITFEAFQQADSVVFKLTGGY